MIQSLEDLCKKHKGKHKLKVNLIDSTNRQTLNLFSTDKKVTVDTTFIAAVEKEGLGYKLNWDWWEMGFLLRGAFREESTPQYLTVFLSFFNEI